MTRKEDTSLIDSVSEQVRVLVFSMACACGIAMANIYYNQPMLEVITRSFPGQLTPSLIPTAIQLGYTNGLLLLVPLGDLLEHSGSIVSQFLFLVIMLLLASVAPTGGLC